MVKVKKTSATNPGKKGSQKQAGGADPYAAEMQIWEESTGREAALEKLHSDGLLPEKQLGEWKAPGNHRVPVLNEEEIVLFTPFVERGLGLPTSNFFRELLYYYGIRMNHLNPNSILQLSIFIHLCEAFLGIPPSICLFRYFFKLKLHPHAANPDVVGGAGFQFRIGRKTEFLTYTLCDSNKNRKSKWFYSGNVLPSVETHV